MTPSESSVELGETIAHSVKSVAIVDGEMDISVNEIPFNVDKADFN
jgi:hypothetical protein